MGSIEEDIKQLESLILDRESFIIGEKEHDEIYLKDIKAINSLINNYTQQKQINEEHKKRNAELMKAINTVEKEKGVWIKAYQEKKDKQFDILRNSIPKQKIKDIVDECIPKKENIITHEIEYSPNTNANSYLTEQILGLLQESEDK